MTQLVLKCQKEELNYNWSDSSPRLQRGKKKKWSDDCAGTLRGTPTYSTPLPILSVTLHVYMATWYTNTPSVMEKRERGIEQARGCCVILLKVCVFNWLIFISSFVVRVHISGLHRQVGQKLREQSRGRRLEKQRSVWLGKSLMFPRNTNFHFCL